MNTVKKIKIFRCTNADDKLLQTIENEINEFAENHNVVDVKVTSCCNANGWWVLTHTVIYTE